MTAWNGKPAVNVSGSYVLQPFADEVQDAYRDQFCVLNFLILSKERGVLSVCSIIDTNAYLVVTLQILGMLNKGNSNRDVVIGYGVVCAQMCQFSNGPIH